MHGAISYKRFSSPKQGRGDSDRRQTDLTQDYCRRHRLRLINTYLDAGLSGFSGENLNDGSALRALLHAANAGAFKPGTRLIVESLDRLSRREISLAVRLFLDILDTGLVIVTLIDGEQVFTKKRVDNDLTALIIVIVFLSRANNESKNKRERALQAQQTARRKARERKIPITAECPRWLRLVGRGDDRHFVVDRDRARVVEHIFKLAASGTGQLRIVRYLNLHRVPTLSGIPKWRPGMIAHVLRSRAVLGIFHPCLSVIENGKRRRVPDPEGPIKGYFPAIVSEELFNKARLATRNRLAHHGNRVVPAHNNLVSRIGSCAVCGHSLYLTQTADGFAYLRCVNVRDHECSNRSGFPYRKLEAVLLAFDDLSELVIRLTRKSLPDGGSVIASDGSDSEQADREQELVERSAFVTRFKAARAMIGSTDILVQHLARRTLVNEFRGLFEGVVLHVDRIVTLHLKADIGGCHSVYAIGSDGLRGIQVKAADGRTGFIDPAVLNGLVRPVSSGGKTPAAMNKELWRPCDLDHLVESVRITHSPNGDWQAAAHDPTQMSAVIADAERALISAPI